MYMDYDTKSVEPILQIFRIKGKEGEWCPAVQITNDHEGDAIWVAALLYNVYARYLEVIPDANQNDFENNVKEILNMSFDSGMELIETIDYDV